jgi:tetratricopeptide (TPR) repeat protein
MGHVYEAEQLRPVVRRVAIKVLKLGSVSRQTAARFDAERQLLALMSHPSIATVFDAGTTESGRPYFVMELVDGVPITHYCDRQRLDVDERLRLVVQVCEAVQHAHQKGIVHRDLKPSNVLVAERDGRPVPKVIDFGIAKLTRPPLGAGMVETAHGQIFGTPAYMSPEQLQGGAADIDTRSDVYSLGLLLYELLVGRLPWDDDEPSGGGFDVVRRKLEGDSPPSPSGRLTRLGADAATVAAARRSDPVSLARRLRADLDWITTRALEPDRERRYPAASELAADLRRHLADLPVLAGPPSAIYRLRKLVRRHRAGVAAAAFGLLALLLGTVGTTVGLVRSRHAEAEARREARTAREVSAFLVDLFKVSQPSESLGNTITAREILDRGAERMREGLQDEPLVKAELLSTIGTVYRSLGLYGEALPLHEQALELRRELLGEQDPTVASSLEKLAILLHDMGRPAEARPLLEQSLAIREATYGPEHTAVATALGNLAYVHWSGLGDFETARELQERALAIRDRILAEGDERIGESLTSLGGLHFQHGDMQRAEHYFRRALELSEEHLDPLHPQIATSLNNLAMVLLQNGAPAEALSLLRRAVEIQERVYGPDHPDLAMALNNLAYAHRTAGDDAAAKPLLERAIASMEAQLGPEHPELARALANLGKIHRDAGELAAGREYLERALRIQEKVLGPGSVDVGWTLAQLADLAESEGDLDEAHSLYRRAFGILESSLVPGHPWIVIGLTNLGRVLDRSGRTAEAEPYLQRAVSIMASADDDPASGLREAQLLLDLGSVQSRMGRADDAERAFHRALELRRRFLDPQDPEIGAVEDLLAQVRPVAITP